MQADEEVGLVVVGEGARARRGRTVRSSSRVSSTRTPSRASSALFSSRATVSVTFFSSVPRPAPLRAFDVDSPPCPGSMTTVWIDGAGGAHEPAVAAAPGVARLAGRRLTGRPAVRRRRRRGAAVESDGCGIRSSVEPRGAAVEDRIDRAKHVEARPVIDGHRRRVRQQRAAPSSRSAAGTRAARDRARPPRSARPAVPAPAPPYARRRRDVEVDARLRAAASRAGPARAARAGRRRRSGGRAGRTIETRLVDERQRAIDEVDRHQPRVARAPAASTA